MTLWSNECTGGARARAGTRNRERSERMWRAMLKVGCAMTIVGSFASLALVGCDSGGVGDPCIPEDEYREAFPGFNLSEENIESRSFQCKTRICLVNHFQGRVTCPKGQAPPANCTGGSGCGSGETCQVGGVLLSDCDPTPCGEADDDVNCNDGDGNNLACGVGRGCHEAGRYCMCTGDSECPENYRCCVDADDPVCAGALNLCVTEVCAPETRDDDTRCYIPGTDDPVSVPVCPWCDDRPADDAVYCSCRCGPPSEGAAEADDNFNFCECGEGFSCQEIRKNVGLGDAQIAGSYCVKEGTVFEDEQKDCGNVTGASGAWSSDRCDGLPTSG